MARRTLDYAIFLLDDTGHVQSWNAGAQRIKGYEEADILGKHFSLFYTPEDLARDWPAHELRLARLEGRFEDEGWRLRKDGSRFWASVVITALRDDAGKLLAFSKITRDLSGRKRQEEQLRASEERFRLLVEGVTDYAIYLLSPEGIVTSWNEGARRITGYEAVEILGLHFSKFYDAQGIDAARPWAELAMAREHGRAEDEGWRVRKDGSRFWARVVVTALHDAEGRLRGFAKVTQDLTQRRHAQLLEETSRKLNDFIAVLAHELRNPLAPIRNAADLLKVIKPGNPLFESTRQIIERQGAQLARIVDDLLDVSRITRGALQMDFSRINLADVVSRSVETARPVIEAGRHMLRVDLPQTPVYVQGDAVRLTQALSNVLNNAARYSDPGGSISLRVYTVIEGTAETGVISVRDTGHGIEPALLGSIFGMFVQGRDPSRQTGAGLGIGLALSRSIVELHHGTMEARSEGPGKGAEFLMRLPLVAQADDAPSSGTAPPKESLVLPVPVAKLRLLVVDDNVDAAWVLANILESQGHEVRRANTGEETLAVSDEFDPDIVLLDIGMPGMNGLEVARHLRGRARTPRPLLVALTGWGKSEDRQRSREAGFDMHLVKPVDEAQILDLIAERPRRVR